MDSTGEMSLYGYPDGQELEAPLRLTEVTFAGSPTVLRQLAAFLQHAANLMDRNGTNFGHEHFSDFAKERHADDPDIIVSRR